MSVRWGRLLSGEQIDPGADAYGGGLISRRLAAAAGQVIRPYGGMRYLAGVWEDQDTAYKENIPHTSVIPQYQFVRGDGYGGVLPIEEQTVIPRRNPWE